MSQIFQTIVMYFLITSIFQIFKEKSSPSSSPSLSPSPSLLPSSLIQSNEIRNDKPSEFQTVLMGVNPNAKLPVFPTRDLHGRKLGTQKCLFKKGITLDFYLFLSEKNDFHYQDDLDKLVCFLLSHFLSLLINCDRFGTSQISPTIPPFLNIRLKILISQYQIICIQMDQSLLMYFLPNMRLRLVQSTFWRS
jgi:hypothetical protein